MKLGIDFGTCYSSASLLIEGVLRPVKEPIKPTDTSFPSSVCVTKKGDIVISVAAENQRRLNPLGYKNHFKRDLDTDFPYFLGEQPLKFMPEDLVTIILKGLKTEAEKVAHQSLDSAVITIPATYLSNKRQIMTKAAQKAGFTEITLLEEPVAAAIYYAHKGTMANRVGEGDILLVYDLGGGTFDGALIQKTGDSYKLLCQPVGEQHCGGIDFDRLIAQDFIKQLDNEEDLRLLQSSSQEAKAIATKLSLLDWCRNFKHQLSFLDEYEDLPPVGMESYSLSRAKFEEMITPFMDRSCHLCEQLVQQSGVKWERIDRILLVGGSCRIPYIKKRLESQFQRPVVQIDDPELAICYGAAIYGTMPTEHNQIGQDQELNQSEADQESIEFYTEAIQLDPDDVYAYYERAEAYFNLGQYQKAISDLTKVIEFAPNDEYAYFYRGLTHYNLLEYHKAITDFSKAIQLDPNFTNAYKGRGSAYYELGEYHKDIADLTKAIELDPNGTDNYNNRGLACCELGEYQKAISDYTKAVEIEPNYTSAYFNRGNSYYQLREYQKAINDFTKVIELNPNDSVAYFHRSLVYRDLQQYQNVITDCTKTIQLAPDYAKAYVNRGVIYNQLGEYQKAITDYTKGIELEPHEGIFYFYRGFTYRNLKEYKRAIADLTTAIKILPNYADSYFHRGLAYYELREYQKVIADCSRTIQLDPNYTYAYFYRGNSYLNIADYRKAIADYNKTIQLDPSFTIAHNNLQIAKNALGK